MNLVYVEALIIFKIFYFPFKNDITFFLNYLLLTVIV